MGCREEHGSPGLGPAPSSTVMPGQQDQGDEEAGSQCCKCIAPAWPCSEAGEDLDTLPECCVGCQDESQQRCCGNKMLAIPGTALCPLSPSQGLLCTLCTMQTPCVSPAQLCHAGDSGRECAGNRRDCLAALHSTRATKLAVWGWWELVAQCAAWKPCIGPVWAPVGGMGHVHFLGE